MTMTDTADNGHAECWICTDCAMWHANAEPPLTHDQVRYEEVTMVTDYFILDCGEEDGTIDFSTAQCDACRTPLAGTRHRAWLATTMFDDVTANKGES